jgi:hypothetical protein
MNVSDKTPYAGVFPVAPTIRSDTVRHPLQPLALTWGR